MKALIVGTGGVGESMAQIAKRRDPKGELFEELVMSDADAARAAAVSARLGDDKRFPSAQVDARDPKAVAALARAEGVDIVCNLCPVSMNVTLMEAALEAGTHYLDTGMSPSVYDPPSARRKPGDPLPKPVKLIGDDQFALSDRFSAADKLALISFGVEPGMADFYARYAADHLFDEVDEMGVRDGDNLAIPGFEGVAFAFSPWTTIEECTAPGLVWEADKGFFPVEAFSEPEEFTMPGDVGRVISANVEHDEVVCMGRNADKLKGIKRATFKYALDPAFMEAIHTLQWLNLDDPNPIRIGDVMVAPRDVVAAAAPDPRDLGTRLVGQCSTGLWVKGRYGGLERQIYLYQLSDAEECVARYGTPIITAQTAFTPVIVLEMLATGKLAGYRDNPTSGTRVAEEFCADPFVALMPDYGFPGGVMEMDSEFRRAGERSGITALASA